MQSGREFDPKRTLRDAQVYPTQLAWLRHGTRRIERLGLTGVLLMLVGRGYPSRGPRNVVPSAQVRFGGDAGQLLIKVITRPLLGWSSPAINQPERRRGCESYQKLLGGGLAEEVATKPGMPVRRCDDESRSWGSKRSQTSNNAYSGGAAEPDLAWFGFSSDSSASLFLPLSENPFRSIRNHHNPYSVNEFYL